MKLLQQLHNVANIT